MRFVEGGPDLPIPLLQAQRDGTLVILTGAGISKPAGLDLFGDLTKKIINELDPEGEARTFFEKGSYDTAFFELEKEFGREEIELMLAKHLPLDSSGSTKPKMVGAKHHLAAEITLVC